MPSTRRIPPHPDMKLAAAKALAGSVRHPTTNRIRPSPLDRAVAPLVVKNVARAWSAEADDHLA